VRNEEKENPHEEERIRRTIKNLLIATSPPHRSRVCTTSSRKAYVLAELWERIMRLVEELSSADAPQIEKLFAEVWLGDAEEYPLEWRKRRALRREEILDEMKSGYHYFGIRIDGVLACVYKALITGDVLFGEHLSVSPIHQGKGLASLMYEHFLEFAKKSRCKKVRANILVGHEINERFVRKYGFEKSGEPFYQAKSMLVQAWERQV
jgi:GNAT superfamily N-acetyltransferase